MALDTIENAKQLLDSWVESLTQVLEAMTDQRPAILWKAVSGPFNQISAQSGISPDTEILWWEQPFQLVPDAKAWVAAARATWEQSGTLTLKAAGLETVELTEARNTWLEILGQSLSAMSRSIGSLVGREVNCDSGAERSPGDDVHEWAAVSISFSGEDPLRLLIALSPKLVMLISGQPAEGAEEISSAVPRLETAVGRPRGSQTPSRTMELLLDVDLPVSISFGKAELPLRDVLKLTTGSIVELNRGVNELVEVLVNHCLIARGEVVVVEGNYGVRIQQIADRQERLRSIP
jgi:flagellar motor switch protein FliN/FliY